MDTHLPYHIPALLEPTVNLLITDPDGVYVDCTMGGAGHSRAILKRLSSKGRLLGFDQDADARRNIPDDPRFIFVNSNFRYLYNFLRYYGIDKVDGILADLGVSFHHFDEAGRGFSFREDAPLDMRMNRNAGMTAADLLADFDEESLRNAIEKYTDLKKIPSIVKAILAARQKEPVMTTGSLAKALEPVLNPKSLKKDLAQVFQMLRIMVNDELGALNDLLDQADYVVKTGGRIAVLSYHSGEDRLIKSFIKTGYADPMKTASHDIYGETPSPWNRITRSPVVADDEEVAVNPRSRSAKLRVAERNSLPWPPAGF